MNKTGNGGNSSDCRSDQGRGVVESVESVRSSSDSLDNSRGGVVEGVNSCWRGSDSLDDSRSSGVVNCMDDSWSCVMESMESCGAGPEGLDNSWLMVVVNGVNGTGADLLETAEECRVGSESGSKPGTQISLMETVMNDDRAGVMEGAENSGLSVVDTVNSHRGMLQRPDSGGGVVGDHSSRHDLRGCGQGRRGEHRQGGHQEAGLRCAK